MEKVWYILEDSLEFKEGYIIQLCNFNPDFNPDPTHRLDTVIYNENGNLQDGVNHENVFKNKDTALNIYKGMLRIEREKVNQRIYELQKYNDELFEKSITNY